MSKLVNAIERQQRLGRFLSHLFQRLADGRLNLVVGAGISIDAGVPAWTPLLKRLATRSPALAADLDQHHASGLAPEYLGQIIYHRHCSDWEGDAEPHLKNAVIKHEWVKSIHTAIYQDVPDTTEKILAEHPYLSGLRDLVRKVPLVINFNFDDILSDALSHQAVHTTATGDRSFTVTWNPPLVDRPKTTTIYHVNGYLPRVTLKKRSPELVFTEDSFAAALSRAPEVSGEYLFLRFVQNTMLIIGHSLGDNSLKNYLRRNRNQAPANHHYMIHWLKSGDEISPARQTDIFEANLELYNLITIFLTSQEISELLDLLNSESRDVRDFLDDACPDRRSRFHYYIVGPVAAGKSTLLEQLRCFGTFEEWTRPPPKEMFLSFDKLTAEQQNEVSNFLYAELKEKNIRMTNVDVGFYFMDRAPLDLYAFSKDDLERMQKTKELKDLVTRDKNLQGGQIVFVTAEGRELVARNLGRGRLPDSSGDEIYLEDQSNYLQGLYEPSCAIVTTGMNRGDIAKKVAREALLGEYDACNLSAIMERFE
ncbi:SIR2 family protein [Filomicrobium sp.]|uniref:SIR2 family protein n=1 Tax=Filomicrobium sp. TaxID=2024831 RepID=UPI0025847639|nr:SIR2 family protein [Filomicrobium sp.]MCV0370230.1 SIR2 family protein [Filomicrobium sp.]